MRTAVRPVGTLSVPYLPARPPGAGSRAARVASPIPRAAPSSSRPRPARRKRAGRGRAGSPWSAASSRGRGGAQPAVPVRRAPCPRAGGHGRGRWPPSPAPAGRAWMTPVPTWSSNPVSDAPSALAPASAWRTRTKWRTCGSSDPIRSTCPLDQPSASAGSANDHTMHEPPGPARRAFSPSCASVRTISSL